MRTKNRQKTQKDYKIILPSLLKLLTERMKGEMIEGANKLWVDFGNRNAISKDLVLHTVSIDRM